MRFNVLTLMWRKTQLSVAVVGCLVAIRFVSVQASVDPLGTLKVQRPLMGTVWTIEVVHHGRADEALRANRRFLIGVGEVARRKSDETQVGAGARSRRGAPTPVETDLDAIGPTSSNPH